MTKSNSNNVYQSRQTEDSRKKNSNSRRIPTSKEKKNQDFNHVTVKSKEETHMHLMPSTTQNITGTNNNLSLTSLNINELNSPIKRYKLADWISKQNSAFCCMQ